MTLLSKIMFIFCFRIPRLLEIVMGVGFSIPKIVSSLCKCFFKISRTFGKTFSEKRIRPKFIELMVLQDDHTDDQAYASAKQTSVTTCLVPVYAAGVLSAYNTYRHLFLCYLFDRTNSSHHELLLTVLWDGVVHTSAQVRSASARLFEYMVKGVSENLVSTRVFPALVTLGNDPEM
ncbi:hypothetical protein KUTeg_018874 [Tegillarca granosa]|uniref:Uncharacterized protein n=1 Tax=Tegillarca granosa TaxID=220873 RepID=A0ABQ9EAW3_TEGGR|nr:hypothetical protein KUTeg_018874 [Tegillarca granosa]